MPAPVQLPLASARKRPASAPPPSSASSAAEPADSAMRPSLVDPQAMFTDMVRRAGESLKGAVEHRMGRPLRVATMCSGTESPLLALDRIANALKSEFGTRLDVEHVFSCEIEPWKQAYIQANFRPPRLFRDVRELHTDVATTAYGTLAKVPGDVDVLIAGTSCVDNSLLNNKRKDGRDGGGESAQTYQGMMKYIRKHRPRIVIQENVCSGPWEKMKLDYEKLGYHAEFSRFDTKAYYIPHTRMRVYLFAIDKRGGSLDFGGASWMDRMKMLACPQSSTLEDFMFGVDDARVQALRVQLAAESRGGGGSREVDWSRCESRHMRQRAELQLGTKRPLTGWHEDGSCRYPDYGWNDWVETQVDRVKDLIDINYLTCATEGWDPQYKTVVWNLAQNVDRQGSLGVRSQGSLTVRKDKEGKEGKEGGSSSSSSSTSALKSMASRSVSKLEVNDDETGASKQKNKDNFGITPCLCPTMIPFVTSRGGPLGGVEALALQGIPTDDLILTRMSNRQMKDLAGNAMSTTVVGASLCAALMTLHAACGGSKAVSRMAPAKGDVTAASRVRGAHLLDQDDTESAAPGGRISKLLESAMGSARLCSCEGTDEVRANIMRCKDCGHTVCKNCMGNPEHNYVPLRINRVSPEQFRRSFARTLPARLWLHGFARERLEKLRDEVPEQGLSQEHWNEWLGCVSRLSEAEFRLQDLHRGEVWRASYRSQAGEHLELVLDPDRPECRVSVPATGVKSRVVCELLQQPAARLCLDESGSANMLGKGWQILLPVKQSFKVVVHGKGKKVPSWEAQLGLPSAENQTRFSEVELTLPSEAKSLAREVNGTYQLLEKCGGALGALHCKQRGRKNPLYLFFDPDRTSPIDEDCFVVSEDARRRQHKEVRSTLLRFAPGERLCHRLAEAKLEREEKQKDVKSVTVMVDATSLGKWTEMPAAKLTTNRLEPPLFRWRSTLPQPDCCSGLRSSDCHASEAVVQCEVPLAGEDALCDKKAWADVPLHKNAATLSKYNWLFRTLEFALPSELKQWADFQVRSAAVSRCETCSPAPPKLEWVITPGSLIPREIPEEAATYERMMKERPDIFSLQVAGDKNMVKLRVAVNARSLTHRACSKLLGRVSKVGAAVNVAWRVTDVCSRGASDLENLPSMQLQSCRNEKACAQPPYFKSFPLRPDQLRSLTWMKKQEAAEEPYVEEEVEEALFPELGWTAEARASCEVVVKGGVLADQVGYGKTAVSIALVACDREHHQRSPRSKSSALGSAMCTGRVPTNATLICVPSHLIAQWPQEFEKFVGDAMKVMCIRTLADLNRMTVRDVRSSDVVIVATSVLRNQHYYERVAALAGVTEQMPSYGGRVFSVLYDATLKGLGALVQRLARIGRCKSAFAKILKDTFDKVRQDVTRATPVKLGTMQKRVAAGEALLKGKKATYRAEKKLAKVKKSTLKQQQQQQQQQRQGGATVQARSRRQREVLMRTWGWDSEEFRRDWTSMRSPPLEMFRWRRLIVDEFAYIEPASPEHTLMVKGLQADRRWCLSGTPNTKTFEDVKFIAGFLGAGLGISELATKTGRGRAAGEKDLTNAEVFQALMERPSLAWRRRRHELAAQFLERFVRQNIAEIDEILSKEHTVSVRLTPTEQVLYLEMETHLQAMEGVQLQQGGRKAVIMAAAAVEARDLGRGDWGKRCRECIGSSATPNEALIKGCILFGTGSSAKFPEQACQALKKARREEMTACQTRIRETLADVRGRLQAIRKLDRDFSSTHLERWEEAAYAGESNNPTIGDKEVASKLKRIAESTQARPFKRQKTADFAEEDKAKSADEQLASDKWRLREIVVQRLAQQQKELVGRQRTLRFFEGAMSLQDMSESQAIKCVGCSRKRSTCELAILPGCGHMGCSKCLESKAADQRCIDPECHACVPHDSALAAQALRAAGTETSTTALGISAGTKLTKVIDIINSAAPGERLIIFTQFLDLEDEVIRVLKAAGVRAMQLRGSVHSRTAVVNAFQREDEDVKEDEKVLILNVGDESASGVNLTTANHAIFLHPLLARDEETCQAWQTQAIGRIRRYGQRRKCHIYHIFAEGTLDRRLSLKQKRAR